MMTPLKEVRPFLVQFTEKSQVVGTIRPIDRRMEGFDLLTEALVRKYVEQRETVPRSHEDDNQPLRSQWGSGSFIDLASTPKVYQRFADNTLSLVPDIRESGRSRRIEITSVQVEREYREYDVSFTAYNVGRDGQVVSQNKYRVGLTVKYKPKKDMSRSKALVNPTGFTVTSYNRVQKDLD